MNKRQAALLLALAVLLIIAALKAHAQQLSSVGKLMQPGQLQADPVLTHRIVTESGFTITTEAGDPLRTETDTP
jgi:hypothetical protein